MNASPSPRLPAEFTDLVDKRLAGIITPEEQSRLDRHLEETPGATAYYLALAATEALLPDALALRSHGAPAAFDNVVRPPVSLWRRRSVALAASVALFALLGVVTIRFARPDPTPVLVASGVPAKISRAVGARWTQGSAKPGERLSDAAGAFDAGFVELTMDSGVRLVIEGPASYRITGPNALSLAYGKAVADVPPNAKGFVIDGPGERIIDHGTRFAVEATRDGGRTTVGVLSGEVEVRRGDRDVRLYTDYALRRTGDVMDSVPFERRRFTTEMPTREFDWNLDGIAPETPVELRFDVSRLIHGPGDCRAVFKWLLGLDGISIERVALLRNGEAVSVSTTKGVSGLAARTRDNSPVLHIGEAGFAPGKWELVATLVVRRDVATTAPVTCRGIVTLEDGLALTATASDFTGRWKYSHNGDEYVREFGADGRLRLTINGKPYSGTAGYPYSVKDGILSVIPTGLRYPELHMLRDDGTLVFLNLPYRNARKE